MATLFHDSIVAFEVDRNGVLIASWGDPPVNFAIIGDGFEPNAKVSVGRVWPDPNNGYYKLIWVSAKTADGWGIRTYRNWHTSGSVGPWYGPFDAHP